MTARLTVWYLTHPRLGRPFLAVAVMHILCITAVCTAPQASAATNAMVLNWIGLRDSYGVPLGNYYFAIASLRDQISTAPDDLGWDPGTWAPWLAATMARIATSAAAANILTAEAGLFVGIIALALWLLKLTVSTYWLTVIGEIARAVTGAVTQVTTTLGVLLLAVPIGVFCGAVTAKRGEVGRGWTMIGIALTLPALSLAVFADPAGLMYGPDGLLTFGRDIGFSVAAAATHNGTLGGPDATGQVDTLTASLITHTVREPLQLWNFGHVVDQVGGCGPAWSASLRSGDPNAPIRAMAACGDQAAVSYASHVDATNAWVGLILIAAASLLAMFMVASGWAVLRVSVKAIWTTVILLPTLWLGAVPGAPQRRATEVVWQFFRHGIEVLVYIVFVSVIGLAVQRLVSAPLPAELGGTNPFAHVLMMGGASLVGLILLRHIKADLSGRPAGRGLVSRATTVAVGMGLHAAVGGAGAAAAAGGKSLLRGRQGAGESAPWENSDPSAIHGAPQPGFDPIGVATAGGAAAVLSGERPETGQREFGGSSVVGGGQPRIEGPGAVPAMAERRERGGGTVDSRPGRGPAFGGPAAQLFAPSQSSVGEHPAEVPPMIDTHHDVPLPEPPPDHESLPPDPNQWNEAPPTPTTVEPNTDT
ncbi:hypothetical protein PDG61_20890 [Mycolicibacterium sp. BiH015]|uniref:hypothetical protein n=1 Tax=Mycolicibacterium sp. BiH015 TaxID=3018808 RepID=UPI0022E491C1|nr:hypothetical protein [Mycolicibacterium sp. BiH015]MDA2893384.1 hypothetical protein [Mycolicibacterium sp. BiH015]